MNKKEAVVIFEKLINDLYEANDFCDQHEKEVEDNIHELGKLIPDNKFTREILLLLKTCKIAKGERKEHIKIAIISDLEHELRKIKEIIHEDEFQKE